MRQRLSLNEYESVLRRPKFNRFPAEILEGAIQLIQRGVIIVNPPRRLAVSPDEADNRFLECAEASEADYLVTGNKRHFPKQWGKTAIVNARELIETFIKMGIS